MKVKNHHEHISELRVRVNKRLHPNMTAERLREIVNQILDGLPAPEGIEVKSFRYGQTSLKKDGRELLSRGDFGFINTSAGFSASTRKVKR